MFRRTSTFNIFRRIDLLGFFISALSFGFSAFISVLQFMEDRLDYEVLVASAIAAVAAVVTFSIIVVINKPLDKNVSRILKKLAILNEVEPVHYGPVGFQSKAVKVEKILKVGRRSLSGHLPTFLRRTPLGQATAKEIYPLITGESRDHYLNQVNERGAALFEYIKTNHSKEIYSKLDLLTYVERRNLFTDVATDPVCEIIERLETLLLLMQGKTYDRHTKEEKEITGSYEVKIINTSLPVYFIMKVGRAILFDGRSRSDIFGDGDNPIYGGFYSKHRDLLNYYAHVFENLWSKAPEESATQFFCTLKDLIYDNVCSHCIMKEDCYAGDSRRFVGLASPKALAITEHCIKQSKTEGEKLKNAALGVR